jgi:hypothetical protein
MKARSSRLTLALIAVAAVTISAIVGGDPSLMTYLGENECRGKVHVPDYGYSELVCEDPCSAGCGIYYSYAQYPPIVIQRCECSSGGHTPCCTVVVVLDPVKSTAEEPVTGACSDRDGDCGLGNECTMDFWFRIGVPGGDFVAVCDWIE